MPRDDTQTSHFPKGYIMPEGIAIIVGDLQAYTADMRADDVYTVIEMEEITSTENDLPQTVLGRPHTALVEICGVRKGDRVRVIFQINALGNDINYTIIKKI